MPDVALPDVIVVSRDQVSAARALIRLRGGPDRVDPVIAGIAGATPRERPVVIDERDTETYVRQWGISAREAQVLALVAGAMSDDAIAAELHLQTSTVRNHVLRLQDRIGVVSRSELMQQAIELPRQPGEVGVDPPSND